MEKTEGSSYPPSKNNLKGDVSVNICLRFVDGSSMTYNEKGFLVEIVDEVGTVADEVDSNDIVGLWHDKDKITIDWEEIVGEIGSREELLLEDLAKSVLYLDNGQVIDEGQIVNILVDGVSILPNTGGKDVSGYTGNNNVYCESCEVEYEINTENHMPDYCTLCGRPGLLTKEDE